MTADEYIDLYGHALSEAEKRYIRAFGPPSGFAVGSSRNPSTPGLSVASYEETPDELQEAEERARAAHDEEEEEWGSL